MHSIRSTTARALVESFITCRDSDQPSMVSVVDGPRTFEMSSTFEDGRKDIRLTVTDSTPSSKWTAMDLHGIDDTFCMFRIPEDPKPMYKGDLFIRSSSLEMRMAVDDSIPQRKVRCSTEYPVVVTPPQPFSDYPPIVR